MKNTGWIKGERFIVVGLGMTGIACCEELNRLGAEVIVTDTREDAAGMRDAVVKAEAAGAVFVRQQAAREVSPACVIVSPGVAASHPLLAHFRSRGAETISEIELAFRIAEGTMVAITGTNGKTTTTGLAGSVLSARHADVRITGNIGAPLIGAVSDSTPETIFVTEISSFQLETVDTFRPHIGIELNVQADHIERHGAMEGYAAVKRRMIEKQGEGDFALLNYDDEYTRGMASSTGAAVKYFSLRDRVGDGAFVDNGKLVARLGGADIEFADAGKMFLIGEHNRQNAMAAGLAGLLMGVPAEQVADRIHAFEGYSHRIEKIAEKGGVLYVDDSKATNIDSALAAIKTFEGKPIILIIGGDDKKLDYAPLYEEVARKVKRVVVLGPGLRRMADELKDSGFVSVETAETMEQAVRAAAAKASRGDVVLLSPASSSFDLFKDYKDRGERFRDAVRSL